MITKTREQGHKLRKRKIWDPRNNGHNSEGAKRIPRIVVMTVMPRELSVQKVPIGCL